MGSFEMKRQKELAKKGLKEHKEKVFAIIFNFLSENASIETLSDEELDEFRTLISQENFQERITKHFEDQGAEIPNLILSGMKTFEANVKELEILPRRMHRVFFDLKEKCYQEFLEMEFVLFALPRRRKMNMIICPRKGCYLLFEKGEPLRIRVCFFYNSEISQEMILSNLVDLNNPIVRDVVLSIDWPEVNESAKVLHLEPVIHDVLAEQWHLFYSRFFKKKIIFWMESKLAILLEDCAKIGEIFPYAVTQALEDFFHASNRFMNDWFTNQTNECLKSEFFFSSHQHYEEDIHFEEEDLRVKADKLIDDGLDYLQRLMDWDGFEKYISDEVYAYNIIKDEKTRRICHLICYLIKSQREKARLEFRNLFLLYPKIFALFRELKATVNDYESDILVEYSMGEIDGCHGEKARIILNDKERLIQCFLSRVIEREGVQGNIEGFSWFPKFQKVFFALAERSVNKIAWGFDAPSALAIHPEFGPVVWESERVIIDAECLLDPNVLNQEGDFNLFYFIEMKVEEAISELNYFNSIVFEFVYFSNSIFPECKPEDEKSADFFEVWQSNILENKDFIILVERIFSEYKRMSRKYHDNGTCFLHALELWGDFKYADNLIEKLKEVQPKAEFIYNKYVRGMLALTKSFDFLRIYDDGNEAPCLAEFLNLYISKSPMKYHFFLLSENDESVGVEFNRNSFYLNREAIGGRIKVFVYHSNMVGTESFYLDNIIAKKRISQFKKKHSFPINGLVEIELPGDMQCIILRRCRWMLPAYDAVMHEMHKRSLELKDKFVFSRDEVSLGVRYMTRKSNIPRSEFFNSPTYKRALVNSIRARNELEKNKELRLQNKRLKIRIEALRRRKLSSLSKLQRLQEDDDGRLEFDPNVGGPSCRR